MSIQVKYTLIGIGRDYQATVDLHSARHYQQLLTAHVTSKNAWLFNTDMPELQIQIVKNGLIETFAYNKRDEIIEVLKNPSTVFDKPPNFPLDISEEMRQEIYDK